MHQSVRELHLLRYGATTSQLRRGLTDGLPPAPTSSEVRSLVERLHSSTPAHHRQQTDYMDGDSWGGDGRPPSASGAHGHSSYRSRRQRDSPATVNIGGLFPSHLAGSEAAAMSMQRGGGGLSSSVGGSLRASQATTIGGGNRLSATTSLRGGGGRASTSLGFGMGGKGVRSPSVASSAAPTASSADHEDGAYGLAISRPIAAGSYPTDWQRTPSSSDHQRATAGGGDGAALQWLYLCFTLPLLPSYAAVTAEALAAIDRLMAGRGVPAVRGETRRKDVRAMLRDERRYGLLVDIISTRRTVMAGTPHATATAIYRHCEEKYPIYVKFAFVGITDNGTKRVARDIFSGGRVPVAAGPMALSAASVGGSLRLGSGGPSRRRQSKGTTPSKPPTGAETSAGPSPSPAPTSASGGRSPNNTAGGIGGSLLTVSTAPGGGKPLPFSAIDTVHCFLAHPKGDEADILRAKGEHERAVKEAERVARRYTPKFAPPPPPEWLQRLISSAPPPAPSRRLVADVRYNNVSMPTPANTALLEEHLRWAAANEAAEEAEMMKGHAKGEGGGEMPDSSGGEVDDSGAVLLDSGSGQWLFGKALGGANASEAWESAIMGGAEGRPVEAFVDASVIQPTALPQQRSAHGGAVSGADESAARSRTVTGGGPSSFASAPPPATREQHYLLMAQRISERLLSTSGASNGVAGGRPSSQLRM